MVVRRIAVLVQAEDPISQFGVVGQLWHRPEVRLLDRSERAGAEVAVVVAGSMDERTATRLRSLRRTLDAALVLVLGTLDAAAVAAAQECGAVGFVRRSQATTERLVHAVGSAVRGEGTLPSDLQGPPPERRSRTQCQSAEPRGRSAGLLHRERAVLRLVAEGHDTREIAKQLAYSERTVKNVLHDVTSRLHLRNRTHAVAYALRQGLI
ncbi:response regulator transcription factor [Kitasatospora sp. NPDC058965]|uniref:helix-turn-helix transcriptional regulator n=1 Tax=Kitasatospora sp. NPDC058965 TaxID=3346682 RepID=UPI003688C0D9